MTTPHRWGTSTSRPGEFRRARSPPHLPLVVSDHADWPELNRTIAEVGAPEIWVTHGREDALVHQATKDGFKAQALHLLGYEDDSE